MPIKNKFDRYYFSYIILKEGVIHTAFLKKDYYKKICKKIERMGVKELKEVYLQVVEAPDWKEASVNDPIVRQTREFVKRVLGKKE